MQFLRELISNASDACDKKRFLSLTDDSSSSAFEGRIRVIADKESNTLTIEDNGIGLSRKDMKENLGRIAQSGTKKFTEALGAGKTDATNLIGQFGVGFYSAFLVADKVAVVSKVSGGEQLRWESTRASEYTIAKDDSEPIEGSGTRLILTLKEDADKYTQVQRTTPVVYPPVTVATSACRRPARAGPVRPVALIVHLVSTAVCRCGSQALHSPGRMPCVACAMCHAHWCPDTAPPFSLPNPHPPISPVAPASPTRAGLHGARHAQALL